MTPLPEWTSPRELLEKMDGSWQPLSRPLSQVELLELTPLVFAAFMEFRFSVRFVSIDDPGIQLRFNVVASGEYAPHLDSLILATANKLLPPGLQLNMERTLEAAKRTTWGLDYLQRGSQAMPELLKPPALRVCDVRREMPASAAVAADGATVPASSEIRLETPTQEKVERAQVTSDAIGEAKQKPRMAAPDIDAKLANFLIRHHEYDDGHVGNAEPAEQKAISEETQIPESTISGRFKKWFGGRDEYVAKCRSGRLGQALQSVLGEAASWTGSDAVDRSEGRTDRDGE